MRRYAMKRRANRNPSQRRNFFMPILPYIKGDEENFFRE